MPRVAKKVETEDLGLEEAPAPRTRTRRAAAKAAPAPETKPARTRTRRAAAAKADEDLGLEEAPAKKKGRPAQTELLYVEKYKAVWDALPDGMDTQVVAGEKAPRGPRQIEIMEALKARGRKRTTARNLMDECDFGNVDGVVSHMINSGTLEVA